MVDVAVVDDDKKQMRQLLFGEHSDEDADADADSDDRKFDGDFTAPYNIVLVK